jgi:hypothetical protein
MLYMTFPKKTEFMFIMLSELSSGMMKSFSSGSSKQTPMLNNVLRAGAIESTPQPPAAPISLYMGL